MIERMKNKNLTRMIYSVIICLGIFSCSNNLEEESVPVSVVDGEIPVLTSIDAKAVPNNLECTMYIFWKDENQTNYTYKEEMIIASNVQNKIKFMNSDLVDKSYRFLFVATTKANPEIEVLNTAYSQLDTNDKWTDVLINSVDTLLSENNYYGILDKEGSDILDGGSIDGILTRMVGQIVLDIFRIKGSISNPVDLFSPDVKSVLDRVYKIDIEYTDLTKELAFDISKNVIEKDVWDKEYKYTLDVTTDGDLKVAIPQLSNGLDIPPKINVTGGARIKGICGLPSTENIKAKVIFHYYDTTPKCGIINDPTHTHTADCYDKRELVLNLPQDKPGATLLSIFANHFTVNKGGIKLDRIIDLDQPSSFELLTTWDK